MVECPGLADKPARLSEASHRHLTCTCRFLFEEGRLETNPAQALRSIRLGPPLAPKHLTVEEVQRLLSLPSLDAPTGRRDHAILMLLYNTGLRVGGALRPDS